MQKIWESLPTRTIALATAFLLGVLTSDYLSKTRPNVSVVGSLVDTADELEDRVYNLAYQLAELRGQLARPAENPEPLPNPPREDAIDPVGRRLPPFDPMALGVDELPDTLLFPDRFNVQQIQTAP